MNASHTALGRSTRRLPVDPQAQLPGGALVGCAAGFLNVPKIKGTHNAMKSGMVAAEAVVEALAKRSESGSEETIDLVDYRKRLDETYVMKELYEVRNLRPSFHGPLGFWGGLAYSGLDSMLLKGRVPWTFHHRARIMRRPSPPPSASRSSTPSPTESCRSISSPASLGRVRTTPRTSRTPRRKGRRLQGSCRAQRGDV